MEISGGDQNTYGANAIQNGSGNHRKQKSPQAPDIILATYELIIRGLANDEDFHEKFIDALNNDLNYMTSTSVHIVTTDILKPASDGGNIIHSLIEAVVQPPSSVNKVADFTTKAARFTEVLVQFDNSLITQSVKTAEQNNIAKPRCGKNPLEFASMYEECIDLVKAMCEHGIVRTFTEKEKNVEISRFYTYSKEDMEVDWSTYFDKMADGSFTYKYIEWDTLIKHEYDSCLHLAIRGENNTCAKYLIERIQLAKETDVLGRCDPTGLTLLHLAVNFEHCTENQIEFVEFLIKSYPDALKMKSGKMSYNDNVNRPGQKTIYRNAGRTIIKSSAAPYKYFLESKEQTENSNKELGEDNGNIDFTSEDRGSYDSGGKSSMAAIAHNGTSSTQKNIVAEKMIDLLKLSCMRQFGRDRSTLRDLLDSQNQIHLDLTQRTQVTARFLKHIAKMKLEQYLQYVAIPNLQVLEVQNEDLKKEVWWDSSGRKDYAYIFHWLRHVGVTKIIRILVEDDPMNPHSDEVIEHSLKGFDVEEWRWFKWDLCIDTIFVAAPNVREVTLYWSGNKAILKSWAAVDGLVSLAQLEKVHVVQLQSKESRQRANGIVDDFKTELEKTWDEKWKSNSLPRRAPTIQMSMFTSGSRLSQRLSETEIEEKNNKDRWVKCTEDFGETLRTWLNNKLVNAELAAKREIRVAIIDDGVNIGIDDIDTNVEEGETFHDDSGDWPGHYQSSSGHGHLMARLIRDLCPRVKLYIAKLHERWIDGRPRMTPESAAKAIEWARSKNVDIISMSWTIESTEVQQALEDAVADAYADNILLFSACDDQGNTSGLSYPAKNNKDKILKIGSATSLGTRHKATSEIFFDYIAPGSEDSRGIQNNSGTPAHENSFFGSSIATARCAGLAAMILQCIVLVCDPGQCNRAEVRKLENMKMMFSRIVEPNDKNKYIKIWEVLEEAKNQSAIKGDMEGNRIQMVATEFIKSLKWKDLKITAPEVTYTDSSSQAGFEPRAQFAQRRPMALVQRGREKTA